jgi:hypothetical protein
MLPADFRARSRICSFMAALTSLLPAYRVAETRGARANQRRVRPPRSVSTAMATLSGHAQPCQSSDGFAVSFHRAKPVAGIRNLPHARLTTLPLSSHPRFPCRSRRDVVQTERTCPFPQACRCTTLPCPRVSDGAVAGASFLRSASPFSRRPSPCGWQAPGIAARRRRRSFGPISETMLRSQTGTRVRSALRRYREESGRLLNGIHKDETAAHTASRGAETIVLRQ